MTMRRQRRILCLWTAVLFLSTQCGVLPARAEYSYSPEAPSVSPGFQLPLPSDLGTVQAIVSGDGPTLIHLQTAHGNYPAQKKIQAILHYLKDSYGFKTLLLEGSPFELEPEIIRFFPDDPQLTRDVADGLARKALLKGAELFLIEEEGVKAFGIEDLDAYKRNVENFRAVLLQKRHSEKFLTDMEMQIDRLSSPYLNKNLKDFLRRLDEYESGRIPLQDWLLSLRQKAEQALELNLRDPAMQIDRPMLLRYFTLRELETRLNMRAYSEEKEKFLKTIRRLPAESYGEIKRFLELPLGENQLPDPQTGLAFERMISLLPADFNYRAYPNVSLYIGHLILQSELKGDRLFKEIDELQEKICTTLAVTDEEKQLLGLFKDYRLLKKLFALELVPEDYKTVLERFDALRPQMIVRRFLKVNRSGRVKDIVFGHQAPLERLFETALRFYEGTQERDLKMMEKIETALKQKGTDKAVIITGGFHARPFKEHFQKLGFNYALVAPKMASAEGKNAYVDYMLQSSLPASTLESIFQALSYRKIQSAGFDPMRFASAFAEETSHARQWPSIPALARRLNDTRQIAQFRPDYGALHLRLIHNRHGTARLQMSFEKQAFRPGEELRARSEVRANAGFSYQDGFSSYEITKRDLGDLLANLKATNLLAPDDAFDFNTFLDFARGLFDQKPLAESVSGELASNEGLHGDFLTAYFVRVFEGDRRRYGVSGMNFIFDRKSGELQGVYLFPAAEGTVPRYVDIEKLRANREKKKTKQETLTADQQLAHFIRGLYAGEESVFLTSKTYRVGEGDWQDLSPEVAAAARELFKNHSGFHLLKVDPGLSKSGLERSMAMAFKTGNAENDQFRVRTKIEILAKINPSDPAAEIAASLKAQGVLKNGELRILEVGPSAVEIRAQYQIVVAKSALKDLGALADTYASDLRAKLAILLEGRSGESPKFADLYPLRDFPLGGGTKGHIRVVYYIDQAEAQVYVLAVSEKRSENELKDHAALRELAAKIKQASGNGGLLLDGKFLGQIATAENDQVTEFLKDRIGLVLSEPVPGLDSSAEALPESSGAGFGTDFLSSMIHALGEQGVPKDKAEEAAIGIDDLWQTFRKIAQNVGQSPAALGTTLIQLLAASAQGPPVGGEASSVTTASGKGLELAQLKTATIRPGRPEVKKKSYAFVPGSGFLPREYQQWLNGEISNPPELALRVSMSQLEEPAYELLEQSGGSEGRRIAMTLSGLKFFGHEELYLTPFYDSDTNSYGLQVYSPKKREAGREPLKQGYEMTRQAADVEDRENLIRVVMLRKQGKFSERAEELAPGAMNARSDEDETEAPGLGKKRRSRKGDLPEMKGDYFEKIAALVFHAVSGGKSIYHASLSRDPLMAGYSHPDFIWQRMIFDAKLGADIDDIGQTIVKYTLVRDAHPEFFDPDKPITLVVLNKTATDDFERNGYVSGRDFRFITLEEFMAENGLAPDATIDGFTQAEILERLQRLRADGYSVRDLELEIENLGHRIKSAKVPQGKAMTKAYRRKDLAQLVNADPEKLLQYLRASSQRVAGHFQKARYINKHYENLAQSLAVIQSAMPDRERIERELKAHEKVYEDIQTELSKLAGLLKRILPQNLYASGLKAPRRSRTSPAASPLMETGIPASEIPPAFETSVGVSQPLQELLPDSDHSPIDKLEALPQISNAEPGNASGVAENILTPQEPLIVEPSRHEKISSPDSVKTPEGLGDSAADRSAVLPPVAGEASGAAASIDPAPVILQGPSQPGPIVSGMELPQTPPESERMPELTEVSALAHHLADGDPGLHNLMAEIDLIYADDFPGFEKLNPLFFDPASRSGKLYAEVLLPQPLSWWDADASEKRVRDFLSRDFTGIDPAQALLDFIKSAPNPNLEGEMLVIVVGLEDSQSQIYGPMREILKGIYSSESAISQRLKEEIVDTMPKRLYYFIISLSHHAIARYSSNPRIREVGESSGAAYNRTFAFQSAFGHREWDFVTDPAYFWEAFTAYFILGRREAAQAVLQYLKIKVRDTETAGQDQNPMFLKLVERMEGLLSGKITEASLPEDRVQDAIRELEGFRAARRSLLEKISQNLKGLKREIARAIRVDPRILSSFLESMDINQELVTANQILEKLFGPDARVGRTKTHQMLVQTDLYLAVLDEIENIPQLSETIYGELVPADSPENLMFAFPMFDEVMGRKSLKSGDPDKIAYASSGFATGLLRVMTASLNNPSLHRKLLLMVSAYHALYQEGKSSQWVVFMGAPFLEEIKNRSVHANGIERFFENVKNSLWSEDPREAQAASRILKTLFDAIRSPRYRGNFRINDFYRELLGAVFAGFVAHPDKHSRTVMLELFHDAGYDEQTIIRERAAEMLAKMGADAEAVGKMAFALDDIGVAFAKGGGRERFEQEVRRPLLTPYFLDAAVEIRNLLLTYEETEEERLKIRQAVEHFTLMARSTSKDPALFDAAQHYLLETFDFPKVPADAPLEAVLKQWAAGPFIQRIAEADLLTEAEKGPDEILYGLLDLAIQKKLYEDATEPGGLSKPRWDVGASRQRVLDFLTGLNAADDSSEIAETLRLLVKDSPNQALDFSMMDYFLQGKGFDLDEAVFEKVKAMDLKDIHGSESEDVVGSTLLEYVSRAVILHSEAVQDSRLKFHFEIAAADSPRMSAMSQMESLGHGEWDFIEDVSLFEGSFRGYLFSGKRKEALEIFYYLKNRRVQAKRKGSEAGVPFETVLDEMKKLLDLTPGTPEWEQQFTAETDMKLLVDIALDSAEKKAGSRVSVLQLPGEVRASAAGTAIFLGDLQARLQRSRNDSGLKFMGELIAFWLDHPDKVFMLWGAVSDSSVAMTVRGRPLLAAARTAIEAGDRIAFWNLMKRIIQASPDILQQNNFAESFAAALAQSFKTAGSVTETDKKILSEIMEGVWSDDAMKVDVSLKMIGILGSGKFLSEYGRTLLTLDYYRHFRDKPEDRAKLQLTYRHSLAWFYFDYPEEFFKSVLEESLAAYRLEPTIERAGAIEADMQAFYASETLPEYESTDEKKHVSPRKMFMKKVLGEFRHRVSAERLQALTRAVLSDASFTDIRPDLSYLKELGLENGKMTKRLQQLAKQQEDLLDRLFLELVSQNGEVLVEVDRLAAILRTETAASAAESSLPSSLSEILRHADEYPREIPYILRVFRKNQNQIPSGAKQKLKNGLTSILQQKSGYDAAVLMELQLEIEDILGDGQGGEIQGGGIEPLVFTESDPLEFLEALDPRLRALPPEARGRVWILPGSQVKQEDWSAIGFEPLVDLRAELSTRMEAVQHFEIHVADSQHFTVLLAEPIVIPGQSEPLAELRFEAVSDFTHVSPRFDSLVKSNSRTLKSKDLRDLQERILKFWAEGKLVLLNAPAVPYGLRYSRDREEFIRFAADIESGENSVVHKVVAEDEVDETRKAMQGRQTQTAELVRQRVLKKVARGVALEVEKVRQELLDQVEKKEAGLAAQAKLDPISRKALQESLSSLRAKDFAQAALSSGGEFDSLVNEAHRRLQARKAELNAEIEQMRVEKPAVFASADRRTFTTAAREPGAATDIIYESITGSRAQELGELWAKTPIFLNPETFASLSSHFEALNVLIESALSESEALSHSPQGRQLADKTAAVMQTLREKIGQSVDMDIFRDLSTELNNFVLWVGDTIYQPIFPQKYTQNIRDQLTDIAGGFIEWTGNVVPKEWSEDVFYEGAGESFSIGLLEDPEGNFYVTTREIGTFQSLSAPSLKKHFASLEILKRELEFGWRAILVPYRLKHTGQKVETVMTFRRAAAVSTRRLTTRASVPRERTMHEGIVEPLNNPILAKRILDFYLNHRLEVPESHRRKVLIAYESIQNEVRFCFSRAAEKQYTDSYNEIMERLDQIEHRGGYVYRDVLEIGQMTHRLENGIKAMVRRDHITDQKKTARLQRVVSSAVDLMNQIVYEFAFQLIGVEDKRPGQKSFMIVGFQEALEGKVYLGIPRRPGIYVNMVNSSDEIDLNGPGPRVDAQNIFTSFPETLRPIMISAKPMETADVNDIYFMRRPGLETEPLKFASRLDSELGAEIAPGVFALESGVAAAVIGVLGTTRPFKAGEFQRFLAALKKEAPEVYERLDRTPSLEGRLNELFGPPNGLVLDASTMTIGTFRSLMKIAIGPAVNELETSDRKFFAGTLGDLSRVYGSNIIGELLESSSARKKFITNQSERVRFENLLPKVLERRNEWLPVMRENFEKRFGKLDFKSRLDPALGVELAPGVQIFETPVLEALTKALKFPDVAAMRTSPLNPEQFETFKAYLKEHAPNIYDAMDQSESGRKKLNHVVDYQVRVHFDKAGVNAVNLDAILRFSIAVGMGNLSEDDQRFFIGVLEESGIGGEIGTVLDSPALISHIDDPRYRERFQEIARNINAAFEDFYPSMLENYEHRYGSFESRIPEVLGVEILPGVVVLDREVIKAFLLLSGASGIEELQFEPFNAETYTRFLDFLRPFPAQYAAAQSAGYEGFNAIFAANVLNLSKTEVPPKREEKSKLVLNAAINTLTHENYMFFVQTLSAAQYTRAEDIYGLIESGEEIIEVIPAKLLPRFQSIAAQVARSARRFDKIFDVNYEKLPLKRSEVRSDSAGNLTLEPQTRTAIEIYRGDLLPLRFEEYGTAELIRVLGKLLNRKVYSEKAGFEKPRRESVLSRMLGKGRVVLTSAGADWIRSSAAGGRVLLDSAWIEKLIRKSPRTLYILLSAFEKFQGERGIREPLLAVEGRETLLSDIAHALLRAGNGLSGEEKADALRFADLERLKSFVRMVPPENISVYVRSQNYGVAALSAAQSGWLAELPIGAQFLLEPDEVADPDLAAIAFLIPSLLNAAQLVRGIRDPQLQKAELLRHLGQILPGAVSRAAGRGFVIQLETYIQKILLEQHLVSMSA